MKADLHVHSKYSDRPTEWFLRRIGAPECFTEPLDVYRLCRERGMDFVTISDHNRIEGALEIAHLPGTFLSAELTTYFPEDQCKIHCLVSGISESQFSILQGLRENIYDLRRYLVEQNIAHSITHPLFRVNDVLTVDHVEKLIVLFNAFESLNGARHPRAGDLTAAVFSRLTPERIEAMAVRHNLAPAGAEPWVKHFTGGSDDHSGIHVASAYTSTPPCQTGDEFVEHLRAGRHEAGGSAGTSLRLAHSLYHIAYTYYRSRFLRKGSGSSVIGDIFARMIEGTRAPEPQPGRIRTWAKSWVQRRQIRKLNPTERILVEEFALWRGQKPASPEGLSASLPGEVRSFQTVSRISQQLSYAFLTQLLKHASEGRLVDSLQTLSSLATVMLGVAPYITAFGLQHKDERFLRDIARHFEGGQTLQKRSQRRAWVTDTFRDVNGVAHTIRTLSALAKNRGQEITVLTSLESAPPPELNGVNFTPLGKVSLPEYESQKLAFPPFLEVIAHLEQGNYSEVILSTPGPMGLAALAGARLLDLQLTGIYHTDFPLYVRHLTQDEMLEQITWRYMHWFYGQMQTIYVPSEFYRTHLAENGFDAAKLQVLPRGVDLTRFTPERRNPRFWERFGLNGGSKILYVGRVSKEKNLSVLMDAFRTIRATHPSVELVVVGDGPELETLRTRADDSHVVFTGVLQGDELADAYASADLFVFPSTTDTFGNAVLEAQASGLPSIVSNRGGPMEIVARRGSGRVVDVRTPGPLSSAIGEILADVPGRQHMAACALETAREYSWDRVLEQF